MGFGTLFIGYLLGANTIVYPGITKLFSHLVMLLALTKLAPYNKSLKSAFNTLIPAAVVSMLYFLLEISSIFSFFPETEEILLYRLIPLAASLFELVVFFYLLRGLAELARETEVPVLELAALRNRTLTTVYYVLSIAGQLDYGEGMMTFLLYYYLVILLIGFFIAFLNAKLIFGFYMWICLPGDEEMNRKKSSIPWLERLYEKMDALEERKLQRRREADRLYQEGRGEKKEKKKK